MTHWLIPFILIISLTVFDQSLRSEIYKTRNKLIETIWARCDDHIMRTHNERYMEIVDGNNEKHIVRDKQSEAQICQDNKIIYKGEITWE